MTLSSTDLRSRKTVDRWSTAALFVSATAVFVTAMRLRLGPEVADDGAFFLRYAENILRGEFWVWNAGEPPIWGASAPLYPLLIAVPMAFGVPGTQAAVGIGMALMTLALALTATVLRAHVGWIAALAFVAFAAIDSGLMYFGAAGLESPLTALLLAASVYAVLVDAPPAALGLLAGVLAIHKLDLIPAGGCLLAAASLRNGREPRMAAAIAAAIAFAWYAYAWFLFGGILPNSFVTKSLHQSMLPHLVDWRWFGSLVLLTGTHPWLVLLATRVPRTGGGGRALTMLLAGTLSVHLLAYSAFAPFEPYDWYAVPSLFALCVLGAVGTQTLARSLSQRTGMHARLVAAIVVLAIAAISWSYEQHYTEDLTSFSNYQEADRADAGRWVDANVPQSFRVYTMWGNPAYHAHRHVLDGSFLNRRFEDVDLIAKYLPEILILQGDQGSAPSAPQFRRDLSAEYEVVKLFAKSHAAGMDYYFGVLARRDVVRQISARETVINLMHYVRNISAGDEFGVVRPRGLGLYVHPGRTTPTAFEIDTASFFKDTGRNSLTIVARMAPNIPAEALRRGAANVRLSVTRQRRPIVIGDISVRDSLTFHLTGSEADLYRVTVASNGNPDTDWLLLVPQ